MAVAVATLWSPRGGARARPRAGARARARVRVGARVGARVRVCPRRAHLGHRHLHRLGQALGSR